MNSANETRPAGAEEGRELAPQLVAIGAIPLSDRAAAYAQLLDQLQTELEADGRG